MTDNFVFDAEARVISEAETILDSEVFQDNPAASHYVALLNHFKKLYSQTRRMVKMADMMQRDINLLRQKFQALSNTDGLTGVANRRYFDDLFLTEWRRCGREGHTLGALMIDLDFFKKYNDHYGHVAGDACLRQAAEAIRRALKRPGDLVARYGGEEFVVLLPDTEADGALMIARNIQRQVASLAIEHAASPVGPYLTVSQGVASTIPDQTATPTELLNLADRALYQAKQMGRNMVFLASDMDRVPEPV